MGSSTNAATTGSAGTPGAAGSSERLSDAATSVAAQAERTVEVRASSAMQQASSTLQEVAEAIRTAGENLREQQPQVHGVANTAAQQVERAATYLQGHEPREVLDEVQAMARRQPALVIGAGLAVGLALGRLLRTASTASSRPEYGMSAYRGGSSYGATRRSPGWTDADAVMSPGYGAATSGSTPGTDPKASVIASTQPVDIGSDIDVGRSGSAARG
jgi:hypothetical protein